MVREITHPTDRLPEMCKEPIKIGLPVSGSRVVKSPIKLGKLGVSKSGHERLSLLGSQECAERFFKL